MSVELKDIGVEGGGHLVHSYDDDSELAAVVASYLAAGFRADAITIVIAAESVRAYGEMVSLLWDSARGFDEASLELSADRSAPAAPRRFVANALSTIVWAELRPRAASSVPHGA